MLHAYLNDQVRDVATTADQLFMINIVIDYIDKNGFLASPLERIAVSHNWGHEGTVSVSTCLGFGCG